MQVPTASRVFGACRALLAQAKSSSAAAAAATAAPVAKSKAAKSSATVKPKTKAKPKPTSSTTRAPAGIVKPTPVSSQLSDFLGGASEASRTETTKKIWAHIKEYNLQNPTNKKEIICDEKLKVLFDGRDKVTMFEIPKLASRHFLKSG